MSSPKMTEKRIRELVQSEILESLRIELKAEYGYNATRVVANLHINDHVINQSTITISN